MGSTNTWKWNAMKLNCDVDAKFTSFDSYFCDLFYLGNAGIHAYIGENGWCNALDYKKFANPLCQVFPEAPSPVGPQWHCPSEECFWKDTMFDGAAKGYVYADTAEECQALCQSATLGENCEFWSW